MRAFLLPVLLLAACDSPAPRFAGAERAEVTRGAHRFVIYHDAKRAEVIRLGYARMAERAALQLLMVDLIPEVTGCRVIDGSVRGDSGELRARLRCPD